MSPLVLFLSFLTPITALEFRYHDNSEIKNYLIQVNGSNPDITYLYSIGQSVTGQELWVLALGLSPRRHTVGIPEFKYVANMHGNEFYCLSVKDKLQSIVKTCSKVTVVRLKDLHSFWEEQVLKKVKSILGQLHHPLTPEFVMMPSGHHFYTPVLGRVLLLQLIDDLVRGYRNNEKWSLHLLNSTRIHILPTMNPDGFDTSDTNCQYTQGRFNYNGIDLNRNFPDAFAGLRRRQQVDEEKREPEVKAVIDWLRTESFVLSANLHGGAVVASYPYDNSNGGSELVNGASVSPDDDVFIHLAKIYSYKHASMHQGGQCHDTRPFLDGITNGYQWYPLAGGMQDYNYVWAQCLELTLEVSCCKYPPVKELPALWTDNREALLAFIQQVHLGVKGRVFDSTGVPVHNAVVEVRGRNNMCPFRTDRHGEYYRLLLPGNYSFTVTYPGHEVLTETLTVPYGPDYYSALKHDFQLRRLAMTTGRTLPTSPNPTCNYTQNVEAGGDVNRPALTELTVALSLVMALRSLSD